MSDSTNIGINCKAKLQEKETRTDTVPIKIVDTNKNKVVIGTGLATSVPAILISHSEKKKRILCVLLDSGSDGDLVFVQEGTKSYIPFKERNAPQKWRTSNGIFTTTKVGVMDVIIPEFSSSKVASFKPDVVTIPKTANPPAYDLIIGVRSLVKIGAVLDFATYKLTIDNITLPMRHTNSLKDLCRRKY